MKVTIGPENKDGVRTIEFSQHVYVASHHTTVLVLDRTEYALLERAIGDKAAEEAVESGDANTPWEDEEAAYADHCPICGGPGGSACLCKLELRCDP